MDFREQVIIAALPIVAAREETIETICRRIGIMPADYNARKHWPIYLAKECGKFADIFVTTKETDEIPF